MRVEPVISVAATDTVGPTRLRLLTAGSTKLPVVVVADQQGTPAYYVFHVAALQAALTGQLSATSMGEALAIDGPGAPAVARNEVSASTAGLPVVENGRLIGVTADDVPEYPEPSEQDMARGGAARPAKENKRGLWQRLSGKG